MDDPSFAFLDAERRRHFPPARNLIPAHLTLFHKLPADKGESIRDDLARISASMKAMPLALVGLRFLGRGSAYSVRSPALEQLRAALADRWRAWLGPQDRQRFSPHVTIQNKVATAQARRLYEELEAGFRPFEAYGTGLLLWRYRGGPWEAAGEFAFAAGQ